MFLKTGSRQRKKHNKKIKERNEKKDEKHNKKKKRKEKQKKTIWNKAPLLKRYLQKEKKQKHIHTERENSEKRETWKHTEIIIQNRKSRNKEEIFFRR